ncbi:hypothetical protein J6590_097474 [Homalodisca vitripennis]|nr:hypothetical protein J6590_097474 [Homalodisca vitripennis]
MKASSAQRAGIVDRINVLVTIVFTNCFHDVIGNQENTDQITDDHLITHQMPIWALMGALLALLARKTIFHQYKTGIVLSQTLPHPQTEVKVERWCVALLYFRVLPLHFSKHKNSIKTNMIKLKLNSLLKKHSKLVFILDHIPPPKMVLPRADVNEEKHPSR